MTCANLLFNENPQRYTEVRTNYCVELFNEIVKQCNVTSESRILEIGAGTGIASDIFVNLGCKIDLIEPGHNLADYLKLKYKNNDNVKVFNLNYEKYDGRKQYDIILSATAFHWIDKEMTCNKLKKQLDKNGYLAVFWGRPNIYQSRVGVKIMQQISSLGKKEIIKDDILDIIRRQRAEIQHIGIFGNIQFKIYKYIEKYSANELIDWLILDQTFESMREKEKKILYSRINDIVKQHDEQIYISYIADLYIAKRIKC